MTSTRMPRFAWLALAVIWGSTFVFMKWATALITPLQLVFVRVLFGLLPVAAYALWRRQVSLRHFRQAPHILVMSLLAGVIYFYGFARGVELLPSGVAGAVTASIPLFSMLGAIVLLPDERLSPVRVGGLVLGAAGVVLLARPDTADAAGASLRGVLWMAGGCASLGLSFAYARRFLVPTGIPPAALTCYQLGFSLLLLLPLTDIGGVTAIREDTAALLGLVVGLGVLATGVAYLIYYAIVASLGAVVASSVTYLSPVIALGIGRTLGETVTAIDAIAVATILGGVIILNSRRS